MNALTGYRNVPTDRETRVRMRDDFTILTPLRIALKAAHDEAVKASHGVTYRTTDPADEAIGACDEMLLELLHQVDDAIAGEDIVVGEMWP